MKTALVYDRINKWGGAERVLFALHKMFPEAPLYTSVYDDKNTPWAKAFDIKPSFLQKFKLLHNFPELNSVFVPIVFESFSFDEYDLVISVTSEAAKGIITKPGTMHINYCLTPTRYLWSGYDDYFSNKAFRIATKPVVNYLKHWDKIAANRPDYFIAISSEVKNRIKKYYDRDSEIIFPPTMIQEVAKAKKNKEKYFLYVSRMSRFSYYKKADIVIESFNKLGLPLKIVGSGPRVDKFKSSAKPNIEFLEDLTDKELVIYYENCRALIFPGKEDFGLVMAEVQSFGKPVIAYKGGGALDIIIEGSTGLFFDNQNADSLSGALKKFDEKIYNTSVIKKNAQKFSFDNFEKSLNKFLDKKLNKL